MYNVGTTFKIIDQSNISTITEQLAPQKEVLFLAIITSDKGPENFIKVSGSEFYDYFGRNISFVKHGQPLLQAARIINAGGSLAVKRVVAKDATLANAYITCVPTAGTKEVSLKYSAATVTGAKTAAEVNAGIPADITLFAISDIGRGASAKSFNITPEYAYSKNLNYVKYSFKVMENYKDLETAVFNVNSSIIENGEINTLNNVLKNSRQVSATFYEENLDTILGNIVKQCYLANGYVDGEETGTKYSSISQDVIDSHIKTLKSMDILFCTGKKSTEPLALSIKDPGAETYSDIKIIIDDTGISLGSDTGIVLSSGSNGSLEVFGDDAYIESAVAFLDGTETDEIYDVDNYMIDACVDANYPAEIKTKIKDLADFREDFFYFRDMGTSSELTNYTNIYKALYDNADAPTDGIYVSDSGLYYDVIDPYTKKQITVTYGYTLAELLVDHLLVNRDKPVAGILYGMVFDDAIKGTVNYIPMRKPQTVAGTVSIIDEREYMQDNRINYAAYYDGTLALDSQYTRNPIYSQLSYINNILITQQVIKAIRKECPKSRFSFMTGQDLERYSEAVNNVISDYVDNFNSIKFEYVADPKMLENKIYNAAIRVTYKDFVQSEIFTIFALPNN